MVKELSEARAEIKNLLKEEEEEERWSDPSPLLHPTEGPFGSPASSPSDRGPLTFLE